MAFDHFPVPVILIYISLVYLMPKVVSLKQNQYVIGNKK